MTIQSVSGTGASTASGMSMLRNLVKRVESGPSIYDKASEAAGIAVRNFRKRMTERGMDAGQIADHEENVFCIGFNQYLTDEGADYTTKESSAELELALMEWAGQNAKA